MFSHTHTHLYERNHHHNQDIHHFQKFFCALYLSFPTSAPGNYWSVLCHCELLCLLEFYINVIIQCVLFAWFISLCIIILRFIHFVTCTNLFLSLVNRSCLYDCTSTCLSLHVFVFGYYTWIAMNMHVQVFNL